MRLVEVFPVVLAMVEPIRDQPRLRGAIEDCNRCVKGRAPLLEYSLGVVTAQAIDEQRRARQSTVRRDARSGV